jgi:chemotaxis protein MotB
MPRRRKEPEEKAASDGFAVMFTSLNLILLSFFILLNAISVKDNDRVRKALGSLRGTFGILMGGENPSKDGDTLVRSDQIRLETQAGSSTSAHLLARTRELIRQAGMAAGTSEAVVVQTADGLRVEFSDKIAFLPGRTEINPRLFPLLDNLAAVLGKARVRVHVRGYADPRKTRNYPSNLELSVSRAVRVARYLVNGAGLPPTLVVVQGLGVRANTESPRSVELFVGHEALRQSLVAGERG